MKNEVFTLRGRVESVLVGNKNGSLITTEVEKIRVVVGRGIAGDSHRGTRRADVQEKVFLSFGFPRKTPIVNFRHFSAVSKEELAEVASALNIEAIPRGYVGENIIFSGIPKFTELPKGTMLFFGGPDGMRDAVLTVWDENFPCDGPAKAIQTCFPDSGAARLFPKVAMGKRGLVGCVFASGFIHAGDSVSAVTPAQKIYDPS